MATTTLEYIRAHASIVCSKGKQTLYPMEGMMFTIDMSGIGQIRIASIEYKSDTEYTIFNENGGEALELSGETFEELPLEVWYKIIQQ